MQIQLKVHFKQFCSKSLAEPSALAHCTQHTDISQLEGFPFPVAAATHTAAVEDDHDKIDCISNPITLYSDLPMGRTTFEAVSVCRPVACANTQQVLPFLPGFINTTIYSDSIGTGWGVGNYGQVPRQLQTAGAGLQGSNATCFTFEKSTVSEILPQSVAASWHGLDCLRIWHSLLTCGSLHWTA